MWFVTAIPVICAAIIAAVSYLSPAPSNAKRQVVISLTVLSIFAFCVIAWHDQAERNRRENTRTALGEFIDEGVKLMKLCSDNSYPAPSKETNAWVVRIKQYLKANMGNSFVIRLDDPSDIPRNVACNNADQNHNDVYRYETAINFHLEKFSEELR